MSVSIPTYDWQFPALAQQYDWDCCQESINWCMHAWGRTPSNQWMEDSMRAAGVVNPSVGCTDASGAGVVGWVNDTYGVDGYVASNTTAVSFDDVASEARQLLHPLAMNGAVWYHWSGVRGYDASGDVLLLANPANGWKGVGQTMNRAQFASLGGFNLVRITHPQAESGEPAPPPDWSAYAPWEGLVGSGLLEMMAADGVFPAQERSTWLPLGIMPAQIEECYGTNGVIYSWLLTVSTGYRHLPT